jgi:hypothetical protein
MIALYAKQDCITRALVEQLNTKHCKYFVFAVIPVPAK